MIRSTIVRNFPLNLPPSAFWLNPPSLLEKKNISKPLLSVVKNHQTNYTEEKKTNQMIQMSKK